MASVPARAALAGNPSDLYGGAVLAVPLMSFRAHVTAQLSARPRVTGPAGGSALVAAALARVATSRPPLDVRWTTDIPRSVGLGGSSAIVIATLKELAKLDDAVPDDPVELAMLALSIERDDLRIPSGLQDRAVQTFGAPVLVDVSGPEPKITVLRPHRRVHVAIGWRPSASGDSGAYHRRVAAMSTARRESVMRELAGVARTAARAFAAGDAEQLRVLMGESARLRDEVAPLSPAHEELARAVLGAGFAPNSAGSGGAVAAVLRDGDDAERFRAALAAIGGGTVIESYG